MAVEAFAMGAALKVFLEAVTVAFDTLAFAAMTTRTILLFGFLEQMLAILAIFAAALIGADVAMFETLTIVCYTAGLYAATPGGFAGFGCVQVVDEATLI